MLLKEVLMHSLYSLRVFFLAHETFLDHDLGQSLGLDHVGIDDIFPGGHLFVRVSFLGHGGTTLLRGEYD